MKYFFENRSNSLYQNIPVSIYENDNFSYLAHWHNDAELTYVKEGSTSIGVNNKLYTLNAGDIAVFNSGDIHYYENNAATSKSITLVFNTEYIGLPSNWPPKGSFESPHIPKDVIEGCELIKIKDILNEIFTEFSNHNDYYELFIKANLCRLCGILLRNHTATIEKRENNKSRVRIMQKVFGYIEDNYQLDISLQSIADNFKIDPYNLSKDFNKLTGTNLKTYINTFRLFKAEEMLLSTNKAITEIALDCGFNSIRSFNRAFLKLKGKTPSSYRKG